MSPYFEYFDLPGNFRLAINSNKKMKTIATKFSFVSDLREDTVTRLALLPMILRRGTRRLPDMQLIHRELESLYGATLDVSINKIGEFHLMQFRMECVNERFLPNGSEVLRAALLLLRDVLLDPLEVDGGFNPDFFDQENTNLERLIESLVDSKSAYAEQRLVECMCPNEPYRLYEYGRVDDLKTITAESLRSFHREWLTDTPLYGYLTGDVDLNATRDLVAEIFGPEVFPRRGRTALSDLPETRSVGAPRVVSESMDVNQAKLCLGYRHGIGHGDSRYEALLMMNGVLGGFSHSKLFQNVREKANLCYSVRSSLERTKKFLVITSGIAPEHYEKARDIITEQVDAVAAGDLSAEEIEATSRTILNHNEMLEDNLKALADTDFYWRLHGTKLNLEQLRENLLKVTADDIAALARELQLDTTYLLTNKK